jgi:dTDP-4-amino-4,6-dideoxygalactose transaminase
MERVSRAPPVTNVGRQPYVVPYAGKGSVFGEEELAAIRALLTSDAHLAGGEQRTAFEREFARYVGADYAVSVTSCTVALEFATHLAGIRPGDHVVVSPLTFHATATPLLARHVDVSFCDVDEDSLCMDATALRALVTRGTRAIFVTHYGGLMADMERVREIADECGAVVIEDCAHALGSTRNGHPPGHFGDIACWSFQSLKNISTLGQGGMLTLNDEGRAQVAERLRSMEPDADFVARARPMRFGGWPTPEPPPPVRHDKNAHSHDCVAIRAGGTNSIMSEPAAAVGRVQLTKLAAFVDRRAQLATKLDGALGAIPGVGLPCPPRGSRHAHHLYWFYVEDGGEASRDSVASRLERLGVEIVLRYFPIHLLPEWRLRGGGYGDCPVAERVWFERLVNLPLYPTLSDLQLDHMATAVAEAIGRGRPRRRATIGGSDVAA